MLIISLYIARETRITLNVTILEEKGNRILGKKLLYFTNKVSQIQYPKLLSELTVIYLMNDHIFMLHSFKLIKHNTPSQNNLLR